MPRDKKVDAQLYVQIFAPHEKQDVVNVARCGTLHHPRYGNFTLGMTMENDPKIVLIQDSTQRVSLLHISPVLVAIGEEMVKQ
jgi:hypothetical protein